MSRHRNVRSMNYEDECYDDDDYLGHSVEDSYCISPGTVAQFTFNRGRDVNLSSYMEEEGIPEEDEDGEEHHDSLNDSSNYSKPKLSDTDEARLNSCMEGIRNVLGESCPDHIVAQSVIKNNYNMEAALNDLLIQQDAPKPQRAPRQNRRNRSQGDDDSDDFDDFLDSLNSQSPDKPLFFSNQNPQIGILKFGQSPPVFEKHHNAINKDLTAKGEKLSIAKTSKGISLVDLAKKEPLKANTDSSLVPKGNSLADLAKQNKAKIIAFSPPVSKGLSLAELAKKDQTKIITGSPPISQGISLVDLAKQDKAKTVASSTLVSKGISLADLAKQDKTKITSGSPPVSKGLSLAELAKQDKTKIIAGSPSVSKGLPLADLAQNNYDSTSVLSEIAKQGRTKEYNIGNQKVVSSQVASSGISLAEIAKEQRKTVTSSGISEGAAKGITVMNVEDTRKKSSSLADLAKQNTSVTKSQTGGLSLVDYAKQNTSQKGIGLAEMSKQELTPVPPLISSKTDTGSGKDISSGGVTLGSNTGTKTSSGSGLSLADIARQHRADGSSIVGSLSGLSLKDLAAQKNVESKDTGSKIENLSNIPPISLKDLAIKNPSSKISRKQEKGIVSKDFEISPRDVKSTQGLETVSDAFNTLNLVDNQLVTGQMPSQEITVTLCAKPSTLAKSVCFQSRMSYNPGTGVQVTHQTVKFPKFSYSYQTKHHASCVSTILHQHITPFDFSTPSPDDVVKSKQKAAFTRSGIKELNNGSMWSSS